MSTRPLLAARDLAAPLAWRAGVPVSASQFIAEAAVLAETLPTEGRPVNLCQDRYRFALGLAAALLRGQTSLMPPNALPETLAQLRDGGPAPYALVDDAALDTGTLPRVFVEPPASASPLAAAPEIPAALEAVRLLTSGSTGAPQPHGKRWGQLVQNIGSEAERLAEGLGLPSLAGLAIVATVPAQHSYGFESTVLLAMLGGASFDGGRPFYPADIVDALARVPRPRALVTTPFHLKTLLAAGLALPPVDLVLSATAPLSPQLAAQAEDVLGCRLIEIYGCTEAGQVASRRTTEGESWTALGALRLWQQGEQFLVHGGHVLEPTPLADVLELIDERRFRLLGRANDLIHVAGKRSSLAHLNFQLNRIDGVDDGAFWLPPQDDGAEIVRPVAFVVAPGLTAAQVIAGLRERLEGAFVPRRVVHVPSLPREATGKLTAGMLDRFATETLGALDGHAFTVPADHPAFEGHFPGHPMLPGVVLLTMVMQALERQPALAARAGAAPQIDSVKFLAPAGPGMRLRVFLREQGAGVAFDVKHGDTVLARGQLSR